eukprot:CAMPEP_0181426644 /NCGR_PEP_ID=MMETSP1110-20121109/15767_1 /TAXON_ID=174948 /ORGANISM="Symbiodinium sp., Strain CCMP421" /LENGTH=420 /DNA_ID=CAMNT_0023549841 /DNA_START=67 /DNA_END=1329 /DNA_ORIENTATION=-
MQRLLALAALAALSVADDLEKTALESDVCEGEECTLSLRQLRGERMEAEIARHQVPEETEETEVTEVTEVTEAVTEAPAAEVTEAPAAPVAPTSNATNGTKVEATEAPATTAGFQFEFDFNNDQPETTASPESEDEEIQEELAKMNETKMQEDIEREEGGLCCFSGENSKDTCGTCYPMSIASYKTKCSRKSACLGECKGTWCPSKCVLGAADPLRKCATAYKTGTSKDPYCSKDKEGCDSCQGEWCRAGWNSHFTLTEGSHGAEVPEYVAPEETRGICCYRGTDKDDTCGTCADVAKDSTCSTKSKCGGCGGTWCHGPRCVKAFKDKKEPCNSAFPFTGIAAATDYCALNEKHCSSCHGAWCMIGNITFSDGVKYDPNSPYESPSDQRLEPVNQTEIKEAEQEVASDEGLTDLFPDGLA